MIRTHQTTVETSQSVPEEIEAGGRLAVTVSVSCPFGCDLRGRSVQVMAPDGVVATTDLTEWNRTSNETEECAFIVPSRVGAHIWRIRFPPYETDTIVHREGSLPIVFRTTPHSTNVTVWDVPSPVTRHSPFTIKAGMQCSCMCQLTGKKIEVHDETGSRIGEGRLGEALWTGTNALYWTDVDLVAPAVEGVSSWSATFTGGALDLHEAAAARFSFRSDKPPEHRVTVKVIEKETKVPVEEVEIRLGFYVATTNQRGIASVDLPKGTYELSIRKDGYQADPMKLDVRDDCVVDVDAVTAPTRVEIESKMMTFADYPWG